MGLIDFSVDVVLYEFVLMELVEGFNVVHELRKKVGLSKSLALSFSPNCKFTVLAVFEKRTRTQKRA